jgi:predicted oxidoreductase
VEESKGYVETALPILGQPNGEAFLVFDERIKKSTEKMETYMEKYLRDGQFLCAQTSQELAIKANIDVENFQKTINPFYPYGDLYGTWVKPAIVMTHGGLKIDANAQVIHHQGFPIPHLYAAGDNAGGLGGGPTKDSLCPGYLMGCGYLWALSSGRIAGRNVATQ